MNRTIDVALVDEDGTHEQAGSLGITVQNLAPAVTALLRSATTLDEAGSVTLNGTFADAGVLDPHTVRIRWGDGTAEQVVALASGARDFAIAHQYLDDRSSNAIIAVRVNDGVADSSEVTTEVAVRNVAPTFRTLTVSSASATEGATLTLSGDVDDVGTVDTHTVTVDWGDHTPLETPTLGPGATFSLNHVYSVPGDYEITTTAADDDGGIVQEIRPVVIADLPPVIAPADFGTVAEGTPFTRTGHFSDASGPEDAWTATVRYDTGPVLPLPLNSDQSFVLQNIFPQGSPHTVTVSVNDRFGQSDTETFTVQVTNVAPAVQGGPDVAIRPGAPFVREIVFTDPGADTWTAQVDFGDGSGLLTLPNLTTRAFTLTHLYPQTGRFPVTVTVTDSDGASGADAFFVDVTAQPPLTVTAFQPEANGFHVQFNRGLDAAAVNLIGTETGGFGPADVTVVGAKSGPVKGSLVVGADGSSLTFVRTGATLAPDTYTVTLRSAANGLKDPAGWMLDGNGNGIMGDDFVTSFTWTPSPRVLSVPEFARGPGQTIDLPATDPAAGIPIQLTGGADVNTVSFDLRFDPGLLSVTGVSKDAAAVLATAAVDADLSQAAAGSIHVELTGLTGLPATALTLLHLQASVPATANYGAKHLLDIQNLRFNGGALAGSDDDGMHVVAYLGDADGQPRYSAADALRVQRVIVRLDSGFSPYPMVDPVIVGDVNGNGRLDTVDALLIQRKVVRLPVPQLPDLPSPLPVVTFVGPDPALDIPDDLRVQAGRADHGSDQPGHRGGPGLRAAADPLRRLGAGGRGREARQPYRRLSGLRRAGRPRAAADRHGAHESARGRQRLPGADRPAGERRRDAGRLRTGS